MKRILSLLLLPALLLGLAGCSFSAEEYYHHAQLYLGAGDFESAAEMFDQLGEYEDSAEYALYCAALQAMEQAELALARANFQQVHPFKSSERYLSLIDARTREENGDLEGALQIYLSLGSFENSRDRALALQEAIPEHSLAQAKTLMGASRWEQALELLEQLNGYGNSPELIRQCRDAMVQSAYERAERLYNGGLYEEALAAFESMGDVLDAPARVQMCRSTLYARLEEEYGAVSMDTAENLMARYAAMDDYLQSADRLEALQRRFGVNLALKKAVYQRPWVLFGQTSGEPVRWRLIQAEGATVTLLYQHAAIFSTATDLSGSLESHPAVIKFDYPRLTLNLDKFSFTRGSGSEAEPYQ